MFVALYAIAAWALVAAEVLSRETLERHAWAFVQLAELTVAVRLAVLAGALAGAHVLSPRRFERLARIVQPPPRFRWAFVAAIALAFFPAFWILRDTNFELGDSALLIRVLTREVHAQGFHLRFDEALELYVHSKAYAWLHGIAGWDVARTYALMSAAAGVLAVAVLMQFSSRLATYRSDRLIVCGLCMSSGFFALFFGHVENYSLALLGLLCYLLVSHLAASQRLGLFWPALTLSISLCLHALAGFFLPSLAWLWWERRREVDSPARELVMGALGLAMPVAGTLALCAWIGFGPEHLRNTHAAALKFIPLLDAGYANFQYRFLAPSHVTAVANQLVLTALPGLLAIGAALWENWRTGRTSPFLEPQARFLLVFALCGQFLALTWNPDLGPYRDWDLFAVVGLGYAALGAYLLVRSGSISTGIAPTPSSVAVRAGLPIVVVCGVLNLVWIWHNATRQVPVDDQHDEVHASAEPRVVYTRPIRMTGEVMVLWREGDWRCEFHPGSAGAARLDVYHRDVLATSEATPSGQPAHQRAAVLRQRVIRGDLTAEQ